MFQWRQSTIGDMLICPERFRRAHVVGEADMNSAASLMGTAVHEAIASGLLALLHNGEWYEPQDVARNALIRFQHLVAMDSLEQDPIPWREGLLDERINDVERMAASLWSQMPGLLERWGGPLSVEHTFSGVPLTPDGIKGQGTWDLLTDKHVLIDWKTSEKPWPKWKAAKKLQPLVYAQAVEHETGRWPEAFVFIVVTREGRVQQLPVNVNRERYRFLEATLPQLERMRLSNIYPLNPDSALCSEVYCPFYNRGCPAKQLKELA